MSEDKRHGIGKTVFKDGSYYYGYYECDLKQGEGLFFYVNRDRYSGKWWQGMKHGEGTYIIDSSGMKLKGNWVEGKFME